jgi:zinc/manganese transport system ATP-binding protein
VTGRAAALVFRDLTLGYDRRPAVHHLTGTVWAGDLLALVGPNGAGKSTLLGGIVGRAALLGGAIDRCGHEIAGIAYLPQRAEIDTAFPISVRDFVAMGAWRRLGPWRRAGREETERVAAALAQVSLTGFEERPIGTLSGGQFQRVLFARTIVQDCRLILLDEPFAAVDERTTGDLLRVVVGWQGEGRTVVAALHDLAQVRAAFPTTLLLAREPVAWGPTPEVLAPDNWARSRSLVEAWARDAEHCHAHAAPPPGHARGPGIAA